MARKKDTPKDSVVEQPVKESVVEQHIEKKEEPIYLTDTLLGMEEIKRYGLNRYFLRAILTEKFYTLEQAKSLLDKACHGSL